VNWLRRLLARSLENPATSLANPAAWLAALGGGATASGVAVGEQGALKSSAVFACVRVLSETVASLPLIVYRKSGGEKNAAPGHPLNALLHDAPNEAMTSFTFRETLTAHVATWGNGYAVIERNGAGRTVALLPLLPDRTRPTRVQGRIVYRTRTERGEIELEPDDVLHIPGLGFDGLVGYSVIGMARQAVGLALATEEFGARFFANNARPGAVLEHPGKLGEGARKNLAESVIDPLRGLANAHKVAVLEEGMKLHEVGIPPEDAQFLQTRKFQTAEIARIFRVPPHLIGDLEKATFSNIEHQSIEFVVHTIRPWLVRWEQELMRKLFAGDPLHFPEFKIDGLLRGDIKSRYEAYATGINAGFVTRNEARALENLNPIDGLDAPLVPLNMTPAPDGGQTKGTSDAANAA